MKKRRAKPSSPGRSKPGLRVAAGLLWRRGRVLLLQRPRDAALFPREWEFPGGKSRRGETPRGALTRELGEELGIRALLGDLAAHYAYRYPSGLRVELWFFHVRAYRGRLRPPRAQKTRWVRPKDLRRYAILKGDQLVLKDIR